MDTLMEAEASCDALHVLVRIARTNALTNPEEEFCR